MAERTNNDLQNTTQITDNTMADKLFVRSAIVLSVICAVFYRSLFVRSAIILSVICVVFYRSLFVCHCIVCNLCSVL
jgi:uncharacterized membrane protein YGL010W